MQAGAGDFPHRIQTIDRGACLQIGEYTAATVVRRRHHGNRLARDIDAQCQAAFINGREMLAHEGGWLVRNIQIHAIQAAFFHFKVDGARHDVTRRQLGAHIVLGHEARAIGQFQ